MIKYAIKQRLTNLLEEGQLDWVITGANLGVEQWSAEVALELRQDYNLRLAVMLPYLDFGSRWSENNQLKLQNLKNQADFWSATSKGPYQGGNSGNTSSLCSSTPTGPFWSMTRNTRARASMTTR